MVLRPLVSTMRSLASEVCIKLNIAPGPANSIPGRHRGKIRAFAAIRAKKQGQPQILQDPVASENQKAATWGKAKGGQAMACVARVVALAVLGALRFTPAAAQEAAPASSYPTRAIH